MSKIGFAVQEASICLRCQYRRSIQKRALSKQQKSRQQTRQLGLSRRLQQEETPVKNGDNYDGTAFAPQGPQSRPNLTITYEPYKVPHRAVYFRRLNDLPPPKDSLGFESLGQPAEVLILKERQRRENKDELLQGTRSTQINGDLPAEGMSSSDMLEEMNAERGIISIDQVCKNIEAVKCEWAKDSTNHKLPLETSESVVPKRRYEEVASQLHDGFTITQLAAFLERNEKIYSADPSDLHNQFSCSLYARSAWTPGTTEIWWSKAPEITDSGRDGMSIRTGVQGKVDRQLSRKTMLIERILRYCWRIRPEQDESSLGEMDIRLQSAHLELITNHKRSILKQMSETYGAKVEASSRDQVIRVTSDYDTCLDILKLIIQTLGNIKSSTTNLPAGFKGVPQSRSPNSNKDTLDAVISQIMQLTNTVIREDSVSGAQRGLCIYYLGPDDEDLEDARRLVSQITPPKPAKERRLLVGVAVRQNRDILVPIDVGTGLSLTERSQLWSRWCSRSTRRVDLQSQREGTAVRLNTLENPLNRQAITRTLSEFFKAPADKYETPKETISHWVSNISYWDSVLLGQVLFRTFDTKRLTGSDTGLQPKLAESRREFVTLVPGLVRSLENFGLETTPPTTWDEEFLLIRLIPSSNNSLPVPLEVLPELEIRVFIDESSKTTTLRDVRLVRRYELDLLLPENTMDLRFIRRACVYSRRGGLHTHIQDFVRNSNLDIWGSGRLKTPPGLTLCIPPHSLGPISDGRSTAGIEREEVEYTFASLEHRCEIGVPFVQPDSWADLTYTCIEAGKIGGRRDELGLRQPKRMKNASPEQANDDDHVDSDEGIVDDDSHSASLLRKANALINHIENPPDNGVHQPGYRDWSIQSQIDRGKIRQVDSEGVSGPRILMLKSRKKGIVRKHSVT